MTLTINKELQDGKRDYQCFNPTCHASVRSRQHGCPSCNSAMHEHGWSGHFTCLGCQKTYETTWEAQRCCSSCYAKLLEALCHDVDSSFDPALEHDMKEVGAILGRCYGADWYLP